MKVPGGIQKTDRNGQIGYYYPPDEDKPVYIAPRPVIDAGEYPLADLERRDDVYSFLAGILGLSDEHREHLINVRGIPEEDLDLYATLPPERQRRQEVAEILKEDFNLEGIPGFYELVAGRWTIHGPPGILVPFKSYSGQLQGFQIRRDGDAKPKYVWLSGAPDEFKGASIGTVINFTTQKPTVDLWVCEGGLKATIAALRSKLPFLGMSGVYLNAEEFQKHWPSALVPRFVLCPDADFRDNKQVLRGWLKNIETAVKIGAYSVRIAVWDPDKGKGIDDYLINTGEIPKLMSVRTFYAEFNAEIQALANSMA